MEYLKELPFRISVQLALHVDIEQEIIHDKERTFYWFRLFSANFKVRCIRTLSLVGTFFYGRTEQVVCPETSNDVLCFAWETLSAAVAPWYSFGMDFGPPLARSRAVEVSSFSGWHVSENNFHQRSAIQNEIWVSKGDPSFLTLTNLHQYSTPNVNCTVYRYCSWAYE